jgi:hypothetical protein
MHTAYNNSNSIATHKNFQLPIPRLSLRRHGCYQPISWVTHRLEVGAEVLGLGVKTRGFCGTQLQTHIQPN